MGAGYLTDADAIGCFAQCCQGPKGGIAKQEGAHPDVLHSYFALSGLALVEMPGLRALDPLLGITCRARDKAGLLAKSRDAAGRSRGPPAANSSTVCPPCEDLEIPFPIGYRIAEAAATAANLAACLQ